MDAMWKERLNRGVRTKKVRPPRTRYPSKGQVLLGQWAF